MKSIMKQFKAKSKHVYKYVAPQPGTVAMPFNFPIHRSRHRADHPPRSDS